MELCVAGKVEDFNRAVHNLLNAGLCITRDQRIESREKILVEDNHLNSALLSDRLLRVYQRKDCSRISSKKYTIKGKDFYFLPPMQQPEYVSISMLEVPFGDYSGVEAWGEIHIYDEFVAPDQNQRVPLSPSGRRLFSDIVTKFRLSSKTLRLNHVNRNCRLFDS